MNHYQVILSSDLDAVYEKISQKLGMSMEQVLSCAAQIYAEELTLKAYASVCNVERVRDFCELREVFKIHE